jgi:cbb3-type cytochrome c oxidase subunit III
MQRLPMTKLFVSVLALAGLLTSSAWASPETRYNDSCAGCHGANAEGNAKLNVPALAGQQQAYLQRQLLHFRDGLRGTAEGDSGGGGGQMVAMARALDDAAISELTTYLAGLSVAMSDNPSASGNPQQGGKLYQSKCGACHGGKGEGNAALNSPRLAGQHHAYLINQFQHFQQGRRGYAKEDRFGRQMKLMANSLNQAELLDVLAYLDSLAVQ